MRNSRGQSLVETALMLPIMLIVVLNALNIGYFLFVTVNLAGATRIGAEYAVIGPGSPGATNYPLANTGSLAVSNLIYQDMAGAVWNSSAATVQICSPSVLVGTPPTGTSGTAGSVRSNCVLCTSSSTCAASGTTSTGASATYVPHPDPENATFVLNRIDVSYSFPPLIGGSPFNLILIGNLYNSGTGQYTFHRSIEMRAM